MLIIPFICPFSFSPIKISVTDLSASMRSKVFKFYIHIESGQVYCGKENQYTEINFCLHFPFLLYSISHSNVIDREICVKHFSGTTLPRILKFWVRLLVLCERESASLCSSFPFFVHSSFSPIKFSVTDFSAPMRASLQILYAP